MRRDDRNFKKAVFDWKERESKTKMATFMLGCFSNRTASNDNIMLAAVPMLTAMQDVESTS